MVAQRTIITIPPEDAPIGSRVLDSHQSPATTAVLSETCYNNVGRLVNSHLRCDICRVAHHIVVALNPGLDDGGRCGSHCQDHGGNYQYESNNVDSKLRRYREIRSFSFHRDDWLM